MPGGSLRIQHQGKIIPSREAPRSPGAMRATSGALDSTPDLGRIVNRLVKHRLTQPQLQNLATLVAAGADDEATDYQTMSRTMRSENRNPRRGSLPCGRRCSTPSCRVSPCAGSPGSWASPATPSGGTPMPPVPCQSPSRSAPRISNRFHPRIRRLTFSLDT